MGILCIVKANRFLVDKNINIPNKTISLISVSQLNASLNNGPKHPQLIFAPRVKAIDMATIKIKTRKESNPAASLINIPKNRHNPKNNSIIGNNKEKKGIINKGNILN